MGEITPFVDAVPFQGDYFTLALTVQKFVESETRLLGLIRYSLNVLNCYYD